MNAQLVTPDLIPSVPADLKQILETDPRVTAIEMPPAGIEREVLIPAIDPAPSEQRFYQLELSTDAPRGHRVWTNPPKGVWLSLHVGGGVGLGKITERPIVTETPAPAPNYPDIAMFENWLVVSARFLTVLQRHAPGEFESRDVTWTFADGSKGEFAFIDITHMADVFDFRRSDIVVEASKGKKTFARINHPRTLKPDVDPKSKVFRDSFCRSEIMMSADLARALVEADLRGFRFSDLATGRSIEMNYADDRE